MTGGMMFKAALIAATIATPAMADGVDDVMATVEMRVGLTHCGLVAPDHIMDPIVNRAVQFTGMDQQTYVLAMIRAADQKASDLLAENKLVSFCAQLSGIYGDAR